MQFKEANRIRNPQAPADLSTRFRAHTLIGVGSSGWRNGDMPHEERLTFWGVGTSRTAAKSDAESNLKRFKQKFPETDAEAEYVEIPEGQKYMAWGTWHEDVHEHNEDDIGGA